MHTHTFMEGLEPRRLMARPAPAPVVTIQSLIDKANPGDTIVVKNGTYSGTVNVTKDNLTIQAQTDGSVVVNGGLVGTGINLHIKGLTFQGMQNGVQNEQAAVQTNSGWYLENIISQNNTGTGIGIFGTGVTLINPIARGNGTNGMGASNAINVTITGGDVSNNNRGISNAPWAGKPGSVKISKKWYLDASWEGGGGKYYNVDGLHITGTKFHDNGGPGLWLDGYNKNYLIEKVESYKNVGTTASWEGIGIADELDFAGTLQNNYVHDNSGSGIDIMETDGAILTGNTFINNGLELRALDGRGISLANVTVTGNFFKNAQMGFSIGNATGRNIVVHANTFAAQSDLSAALLLGEDAGVIAPVTAPILVW